MSITSNKTYYIKSAISNSRRLNLYSSGSASNGMNVVLYTDDTSNEQKWYFDGDRLYPETNRNYCLDRYTASAYLNNADIWKASTSDAAVQIVDILPYNNRYYIRLRTKVSGEYYFLTAVSAANGTGSGKSTTSAGNVYWSSLLGEGNTKQLWSFTEVSDSSSGGSTSGTYTINGKTIPLSQWPVGSYWTTDGTPNGSSLEHNGRECAGFARYVYNYLWGDDEYGKPIDQKDLVGTSSDFNGINIGARINCTKKTGGGNHSMVLANKTSTGVVVYHANWATSNNYCIIRLDTWTYAEFAAIFSEIRDTSYNPTP